MAKNRLGSALGVGLVALFGLPFAAIGLVCCFSLVRVAYDDIRVLSWQPVPCQVLEAKLEESAGSDSVIYRVIARYRYSFDGVQYFGSRVGVDDGADNVGSTQKDRFAELDKFRRSGQPFAGYVNPNRPGESILYREARWELAAFRTLMAIMFSLVGFGLLGTLIVGWYRERKQRFDAGSSPKPWHTRADWARGEIRHSDSATGTILLVVAMAWLVISVPSLLSSGSAVFAHGNSWAALGLILPAISVPLFFSGWRRRGRYRRYGDSVFQMADVPGVVGGQLAGVVRTDHFVDSPDGYRLKLYCTRAAHSSSSDNGKSTSDVVWEDEQTVVRELGSAEAGVSAIPVLFAIPYGARETCQDVRHDRFKWRLQVRSVSKEADYKAEFEVPVFKTSDSNPDFRLDESAIKAYVAPVSSDARRLAIGVRSEEILGGGMRYIFPRCRHIGFALAMCLVQFVFAAAIVAGVYYLAEAFFPYVAALFGLLLVRAMADQFLYYSELEVTPSAVSVVGGIWNLGTPNSILAAEIVDMVPQFAGSAGNLAAYDLRATLKNGKSVLLAKRVIPKSAADALASQIVGILARTAKPDP